MMFVAKYTEQRFQYTSEEESLERTHHEDSRNHWKDLSEDDSGQSLRVLIDIVKLWMETVASGRLYVFQQDDASAHTNHLIQNWLSDNVDIFWSKEFWSPNSPDLNLLDYYVWSIVERITNKSWHSNVTSLRTAIEAAFVGMDNATLQCACERFRLRIEVVIHNGRYIEYREYITMLPQVPCKRIFCNI